MGSSMSRYVLGPFLDSLRGLQTRNSFAFPHFKNYPNRLGRNRGCVIVQILLGVMPENSRN